MCVSQAPGGVFSFGSVMVFVPSVMGVYIWEYMARPGVGSSQVRIVPESDSVM